jgi:hypothetical protein
MLSTDAAATISFAILMTLQVSSKNRSLACRKPCCAQLTVSRFDPQNTQNSPNRPKCGKFVKLFAFGTKVLSMIPRDFHHNTLKDIWRVYSLNLIF